MNSDPAHHFLSVCRITIILTFLVIIAGGVVRSTGSGMGCPDWPKCFGTYIPPIKIEEIQFAEGKRFHKGAIIIHDDALYKAKESFTASEAFELSDWEKYTKHDYAQFNVFHTWTEYLNRLVGVLLGFAAIATVIYAYRYKRDLLRLSILNLIIICFQGWLGAKVVDSNLKAYMVTIHMLVALIILALYIYIYDQARTETLEVSSTSKGKLSMLRNLSITLLLVLMIQILTGTQVREIIDEVSALMNDMGRSEWVERVGLFFFAHRNLSLLVAGITLYTVYLLRNLQHAYFKRLAFYALALVGLQIISGLILAYLALPPAFQAIHLVLACLFFGLQVLIVLSLSKAKGAAASSPTL